MNNLSPDERTEYIQKLIKYYKPDLADAVIDCYLSGLNDQDANALLAKYQIKREFKVGKSAAIFHHQKSNSSKRKGESYRIWSETEMKQYWKTFCSLCLITGIPDRILDINWNR